jgi:hypothetical protein
VPRVDAATYSGDPAASDRDRVRFEVGDTNCTAPILSDAEIDALLTQESGALLAASEAARKIAAKYAIRVDCSIGSTRKAWSQQFRHYTELAKALRAKGARGSVLPYVGGLSEEEKRSDALDTDLVQPAFEVGMHDNPEVPQTAQDELA